MTEIERKLYELARRVGGRRFGQDCNHSAVRNGVCLHCLRRVATKRVQA